jgi:hypothetical protein
MHTNVHERMRLYTTSKRHYYYYDAFVLSSGAPKVAVCSVPDSSLLRRTDEHFGRDLKTIVESADHAE